MKTTCLLFVLFMLLTTNAQTRKLQAETNHSTVGFAISIADFSIVTGKFTDYTIFMDWDDSSNSIAELSANIEVKSINTGIPDRDTHLRSSDFFDEEKYSLITFKSDSVQKVDFAHLKAYGSFNMHGVSKKIVLPLEIVKVEGNTIGIRSRTSLNRLDFGVGENFKHSSMPNFLSDEIDIQIDFWTKKRKE